MQKVAGLTTKPLVVVLVHGGPLDISPMVASTRVGAILSIWHPGQHGSVAVADLLLGRASPSGERGGAGRERTVHARSMHTLPGNAWSPRRMPAAVAPAS